MTVTATPTQTNWLTEGYDGPTWTGFGAPVMTTVTFED